MKIFTYTLQWDQPITHFFDQDDVKCVGKRRVESPVVVVAPNRLLADVVLKDSFKHDNLEIRDCTEQEVNLFVPYLSTEKPHSIRSSVIKPVGPNVIDPYWQEAMDQERRY